MKTFTFLLSCGLLGAACPIGAAEASLKPEAILAMEKAARYFRDEVSTRGGYLWNYQSDLSRREGETPASATTIWVQPPGTPAVGQALLEAYAATGKEFFLEGAVAAAEALAWGQLESGGWDYRIDFDPQAAGRWRFRRDASANPPPQGRIVPTTLDDDTTQSALRFLMRVDETLEFKNASVHEAVRYGLQALLDVQYPNGAWPQRFTAPPEAARFPVRSARYPESWPREFPQRSYQDYYTFNDNTIVDTMATLLVAHRTYGDARYLAAVERAGDFMILAQMPEPQPAWAQQYNLAMEPAWARRFEPPAVTGGESTGILRALLDLYVETGQERFLAPVPRALAWLERSRLPDGRLARFYELQTNRPLYFTKDYRLTYDDGDLPTHYGFKVSGEPLRSVERYYRRIREEGRAALLAERARSGTPRVSEAQVREVLQALDARGRWVESGRLKVPQRFGEFIETEIISCATFNRNLTLLAHYVASQP